MKKRIFIILGLIVGLLLLTLGILYAVDMNRMKNNKEVVFSTWGYDYCPPVVPIGEEVAEKNRVKISDVELIAKDADTSILVNFNGVIYARSYGIIDYAGNINNTIGVIDKLIDKEYLPNSDGETNSEELLNAKVLEANGEGMILHYNNESVAFRTIQVVYKTTENNDIVSIKYLDLDNEFREKELTITNKEDIEVLKDIFCNVEYNREPCEGIYTHTITINNEKYYLLEGCKEINHNGKQALISDENIDKINSMIGK